MLLFCDPEFGVQWGFDARSLLHWHALFDTGRDLSVSRLPVFQLLDTVT